MRAVLQHETCFTNLLDDFGFRITPAFSSFVLWMFDVFWSVIVLTTERDTGPDGHNVSGEDLACVDNSDGQPLFDVSRIKKYADLMFVPLFEAGGRECRCLMLKQLESLGCKKWYDVDRFLDHDLSSDDSVDVLLARLSASKRFHISFALKALLDVLVCANGHSQCCRHTLTIAPHLCAPLKMSFLCLVSAVSE